MLFACLRLTAVIARTPDEREESESDSAWEEVEEDGVWVAEGRSCGGWSACGLGVEISVIVHTSGDACLCVRVWWVGGWVGCE